MTDLTVLAMSGWRTPEGQRGKKGSESGKLAPEILRSILIAPQRSPPNRGRRQPHRTAVQKQKNEIDPGTQRLDGPWAEQTQVISAAPLRGSAGSMSTESSPVSLGQKRKKNQRPSATIQMARETSGHGVGT